MKSPLRTTSEGIGDIHRPRNGLQNIWESPILLIEHSVRVGNKAAMSLFDDLEYMLLSDLRVRSKF